MEFKSIKNIYAWVIKDNVKIKWRGEEKYTLTWFFNNKRYRLADVNDGKKDGRSIWWFSDGTKMEECHYVNGKLHGDYILWNRRGGILRKTTFCNGHLVNQTVTGF